MRTLTSILFTTLLAVATLLPLLLLLLSSPVVANQAIANTANFDIHALVEPSTPRWCFTRANSHDTCWPSDACPNQQVPTPADRKSWPIPGQGGCPDRWSWFPTYYSVRRCSTTEVRIAFNLYFKKDGFSGNVLGIADLGHAHDWERVVVVWNLNTATNSWTRSNIYLGRHSGYATDTWNNVVSVDLNWSNWGTNGDHPIAFVGWAKHAMFNHPHTGAADLVSQYTDSEYRSCEYEVNVPSSTTTMYEVTDTNWFGGWFNQHAAEFGNADSNPFKIYNDLCTISN